LERCREGEEAFSDPKDTPLLELVLQVVVNRLAWQDREILKAPVLLQWQDEENFVNSLAEFVWTNRHQLNELLGDQNDDQA